MVRLGLAVTLGALLAGTAAQAASSTGPSCTGTTVCVDGYQSVDTTAGGVRFFNSSSSNNDKISGIHAPDGRAAGQSGGSYDTFITTSPTTVSFEAANAVSGPYATSTSQTAVSLTFTNGSRTFENAALNSTITAAGLGFYVANIGNGDCLYASCSSSGAAPFTFLSGTNPDASHELGTVSVSFQVFRGEATVYDLHGSVTLFDDGTADASSLIASLRDIGHLNGFGLSTAEGSTKAIGYAWEDTTVPISYGSLNPFETVTLTYLTTVTSTTNANCVRSNTSCLLAFAGFGDPIGRGGGIDGADEGLTAFDLGLSAFMDPGSVFDGPALSASGPINGIGFRGASFEIPTFDPETGTVTFVSTTSAAPEPATWAVMIAGFGLAGAALRRRRAHPDL